MSRLSSSRRRSPASRPEPVPKERVAKKPALKKLVLKKLVRKKSGSQTPRQRELNTKRRGELAELAFVLKAASLGFGVSRPFGDSERYDAILDSRDLDARDLNNVGRTLLPAALDLRAAHVGTAALGRPAARKYRAAAASSIVALDEADPTPPDSSPPLWRVQIKCSTQLSTGLYRVNAHRRANGRAVPTSRAKSISSPHTSSLRTPGISSPSPPSAASPASSSAVAATPNPASTTSTAKPGTSSAPSHKSRCSRSDGRIRPSALRTHSIPAPKGRQTKAPGASQG